MNYLTYAGNELVNVRLPDSATVLYPPDVIPGIAQSDLGAQVRRALRAPLEMAPLADLVKAGSRVLIAFDDNCQPFPPMRRPDVRETMIEAVLAELEACGVRRGDCELVCAIALHRKMKPHELRAMVGERLFAEFHPARLRNFDAEDRADIVSLGKTEQGEPVETSRRVIESDLVIYVDTIQIPLNGGHKSVAVGFGTYDSIASHHAPEMTASSPHVMQPDGSHMHRSIERISRVIATRARILVIEAAMNGATYPPLLRGLGSPRAACTRLQRVVRDLAPVLTSPLPEPVRRAIFAGTKSEYSALEVNAGSIDAVHARTLRAIEKQLVVEADGPPFDTMLFGLPDLSPYAVGARINPVLVLSDVLGYVFNWFYGKPFVKEGGAVILINPVMEEFHPEYHVAYRRFWDEVLTATTDPLEMKKVFQEQLRARPRAHRCLPEPFRPPRFPSVHGLVLGDLPLAHLSRVILVGPPDDRSARRLGVHWAKNLDHALGMAREATGGDRVVALTIPPFVYVRSRGASELRGRYAAAAEARRLGPPARPARPGRRRGGVAPPARRRGARGGANGNGRDATVARDPSRPAARAAAEPGAAGARRPRFPQPDHAGAGRRGRARRFADLWSRRQR